MPRNIGGGGNSAQNIQNQQFEYSLAEALGRSQVNFTGKKDKKFQRYDQMFIDTVAQNLRLSKEDKARLSANIDNFLKTNKFASLEAIAGDKNVDIQSDFISELGDEICYSDFDFNILSDAFQDRMFHNGCYEPEIDLYEKDYEVVDHILDKYGYNEAQKVEVFDVLKMEAEHNDCKDVFELFKTKDYSKRFVHLMNEYLNINNETAFDMLIDFGLMSEKDDEARREGIYPWKRTALMNEQAKDEAIACDIIGEYDLEDDELQEDDIDDEFEDIDDDDDDDVKEESKSTMEEITEQLNRRREGVSVEQISYELMEKYNLPSEAYDFIKNTIYEYDADEFADEED